MTAGEIAISISICSVFLSAISLGWNIYRDVILKAKVKATIGICQIVQQGLSPSPTVISTRATNHGPGPVQLEIVNIKDTSLLKKIFKKEKFGVVLHDWQNPLSGRLPHKLEVGESISMHFPYDEDCMLKKGWSHIGISDSFDRVHWANSKLVKFANRKWKEDFKN